MVGTLTGVLEERGNLADTLFVTGVGDSSAHRAKGTAGRSGRLFDLPSPADCSVARRFLSGERDRCTGLTDDDATVLLREMLEGADPSRHC